MHKSRLKLLPRAGFIDSINCCGIALKCSVRYARISQWASLWGFLHCIYVQSLLSPHNPVPIVFLTHRKYTNRCKFSSIPNALESKLESWRIGEKAGFPMNCKEKRDITLREHCSTKSSPFQGFGLFSSI